MIEVHENLKSDFIDLKERVIAYDHPIRRCEQLLES